MLIDYYFILNVMLLCAIYHSSLLRRNFWLNWSLKSPGIYFSDFSTEVWSLLVSSFQISTNIIFLLYLFAMTRYKKRLRIITDNPMLEFWYFQIKWLISNGWSSCEILCICEILFCLTCFNWLRVEFWLISTTSIIGKLNFVAFGSSFELVVCPFIVAL